MPISSIHMGAELDHYCADIHKQLRCWVQSRTSFFKYSLAIDDLKYILVSCTALSKLAIPMLQCFETAHPLISHWPVTERSSYPLFQFTPHFTCATLQADHIWLNKAVCVPLSYFLHRSPTYQWGLWHIIMISIMPACLFQIQILWLASCIVTKPVDIKHYDTLLYAAQRWQAQKTAYSSQAFFFFFYYYKFSM